MNDNWVQVYTSPDFIKTEIVRQVLTDHEIEAVILNKQDSAYKFGNVLLYVHPSNFGVATEIIIKNDL